MELGLGLYARMVTTENLRFAKQLGAKSVVVHMADYKRGIKPHSHFDADAKMWDVSESKGIIWSVEELKEIRLLVESEGLKLAALENINAALWSDVLLDGPESDSQLQNLKQLVANVGLAGIPCLGYNFTLAGVWGTRRGNFARGGASTVSFDADDPLTQEPLALGTVANRVYNPKAEEGITPTVAREELLFRHQKFLSALLPVAEEHGVNLAAHPDDPPIEILRGQPRFMHRENHLFEMLQSSPSPSNRIQFCIGTIAEMPQADVYSTIDKMSASSQIGYIHFRNIKGKVPRYQETFVDDGDIDMVRILSILKKNNWKGVLIPDHTPLVQCDAPWHAGMAYALGFMNGAMRTLEDHSPSGKS